MDALAATGFLFERAYCQQAVCAPSRSSLLSGCRPDTTGVHNLSTLLRRTLPDVVTLPQQFKRNGYTAISLGKVYHHRLTDDPDGWSEEAWDAPVPWNHYATPEARAVHEQRQKELAELRKRGEDAQTTGVIGGKGPPTEIADAPDNVYADGMVADRAVEVLRRIQDQPFFLAVGFRRPHLPFNAPRKYWDLYTPGDIRTTEAPVRPADAPEFAFSNWGELRQYAGIPDQGPLTEEQARHLIHGYYASVSYVDAQIGRVIDELDRLGLRDNTVIVLWGDHGWKLGDYGDWCKHTNFEFDTLSPLIFRVPGLKRAGRRTRALVEFVDIYPTLCELCGQDLPEHLEGISLVPVMERPKRRWKTAAFSQYPRGLGAGRGQGMGYSMRTDRYRFTRWVQQSDGTEVGRELYDHETDPHETVNVVERPENAKLVAELSAMLDAGWRGALPK